MNLRYRPINLTDEHLRKLQLEMLTILAEFDRICKKHDIQYFLSGGTLLGAVRHGGFIPWDDDVDVEMRRSEYERFCEICKKELQEDKFFWQDYYHDPGYHWLYGKLRLKNTSYVRFGQEHLTQKTGICIDVFPLDNISENFFLQYFNDFGTKICRKVLWAKVGCKTESNYFKKYLYKILRHIDHKLTLKIFEKIISFCGTDERKGVVFNSMDSRSARGYVLPEQLFDQVVFLDFEGRRFPAPVGYEEILYFWYGDYLKYPEEADRVPHTLASHIRFSDGTELKG